LTAQGGRGTVLNQRTTAIAERSEGVAMARSSGLKLVLLAGLIGALSCAWTSQASAANWFEMNFWLSGPRYDAVLPACDDPAVLGKISARFAEKERRYWQSALSIVSFDRVHEIAFRPWARGAPDAIPRRFCSGTALVSDTLPRPIHYWIGEDTGMIGASWGVEWCVVGLDRNWAYNPGCRMARP
jgi:hypothetical protein